MFFPTCTMLSSCCGTEIEKKKSCLHFLTFHFFVHLHHYLFFLSALLLLGLTADLCVVVVVFSSNPFKCTDIKPAVNDVSLDEFTPEGESVPRSDSRIAENSNSSSGSMSQHMTNA